MPKPLKGNGVMIVYRKKDVCKFGPMMATGPAFRDAGAITTIHLTAAADNAVIKA